MKQRNEFVDLVLERLSPLGYVHAKRMFGGYGVYLEDLFFALIANETLYLKVDDNNRPDFAARGIAPFHYQVGSKDVTMSYYPIPADVFEDTDDALLWARPAVEAALRGKAGKSRRRPS